MQTAARNTFAQRHLAWLLWLVLLLPLAQTAASWHLLSHLPSGQPAQGEDPQAIHADDCSLCSSAAALIGGVPLATAPMVPQAIARFNAPSVTVHGLFPTPAALAYDSRAPPSPLH
jgi:hypothetical protein